MSKKITKANCPHVNTWEQDVGGKTLYKCQLCKKSWLKGAGKEKVGLETDEIIIKAIAGSIQWAIREKDKHTALRLGRKIGYTDTEIENMYDTYHNHSVKIDE